MSRELPNPSTPEKSTLDRSTPHSSQTDTATLAAATQAGVVVTTKVYPLAD